MFAVANRRTLLVAVAVTVAVAVAAGGARAGKERIDLGTFGSSAILDARPVAVKPVPNRAPPALLPPVRVAPRFEDGARPKAKGRVAQSRIPRRRTRSPSAPPSRSGRTGRPTQPAPKIDPTAVAPPDPNLPREFIPVPDRWRLGHTIGEPLPSVWNPYDRNVLKGDRPVFGKDWFVNVAAISDTVFEPRRVPTAISPVSASSPGANDVFGDGDQIFVNQNLILSLSLIKGDTAFRPQDLEFRLTPVFNANYLKTKEVAIVNRDPADGTDRFDGFVGLQEAFVDYHLRNVSDRYDFDSLRAGIQPFSSDFRGFLFQDNQLGLRFFGNRSNNVFQYNLAWFRRLEKGTNSGLNDVTQRPRNDDVFLANLYFQDFPDRGFVSQATLAYNRNRESGEFFFNDNDFIERPASFGVEQPRDYDAFYVGLNGDGHFGRANLTFSLYYAFGRDGPNQLNGTNQDADISAYFFALEPSVDFDWLRLRSSFLLASGDSDPFDDKEGGFSAIFENPQFAGGDASYWIRQGIPLIGGGGVNLTQRNGVLPDLRSSKEHGQSNFNNPGLVLIGVGFDADVLPELRISGNLNKLYFQDTANLEVLRNQGSIDRDIGFDISAALIYRPFQTQNVVLRASGAVLIPGDGFKDLFATTAEPDGGKELAYSVLFNLVLSY